MIKVLHINKFDIGGGGASIGALRMHHALTEQGISSKLLVERINTNYEHVEKIPKKTKLDFYLFHVFNELGLNYINYVSTFKIKSHSLYKEAEVIYYHNLHPDYFNYLAIPWLSKAKISFLYLHDMWNLTGHCAYSKDCNKWKVGCGNCPYPDSFPSIKRDNTKIEWRLKQWVFNNSNLKIIVPSKWLFNLCKESLLSKLPIYHIPYCIDTNIYKPLDSEVCRKSLNIPEKKKLLLFSAYDLDDERKGSDFLVEIINNLNSKIKSEIILLLFGNNGAKIENNVDVSVKNFGYIDDENMKVQIYSAADLYLFPTRNESFGIVAQESISCSTPVIGFKTGGLPDIIRDDESGFLVEPGNIKKFCEYIEYLLEDKNKLEKMRNNCRSIAVAEYDYKKLAKKHIEIINKCKVPK